MIPTHSHHRTPLIALLMGVYALAACDEEKDKISPSAVPIRVLSYNVGNPNADDPDYPLRLKDQIYEDYMSQQIQALVPDIVLLQEVLPTTHCATVLEDDPAYTCYDSDNRPPPVRRLLGPDYTIVCDGRLHVECIGVHVSLGPIAGMALGGYAIDGAETSPLPLDSCNYAAGACNNDYCDYESTVSRATVETAWGDLRIVHMHPNAAGSGFDGFYNGAPCRALQFQQVFEGVAGAGDTPLAAGGSTLVAGDFNFDPRLMASDEELSIWDTHVGPGNRFTHLNPVDEDGKLYATRRGSMGMTLDHVLADHAAGGCTVLGYDDGFGSDPGTVALDEGFDWSQMEDEEYYPSRIDHFAVLCDLRWNFSD